MIMKFNNLKDLDEKSLLDKKQRKEYTKLKEKPAHTSIFDDDAVADSAVDYLYSKDNQRKTQSFLKNSGFPSLPDRAFNKQLYGVQEEKRQLRDMLKSTTNSILNAKLPTETDRAFLHGLMGEKDGEDDYQKQISDASRVKDDLLSAFRNTPFESGLKPIAPAKETLPLKDTLPKPKRVTDDAHTATKAREPITSFNSGAEYTRPNYFDSKTVASTLKTNAYNDAKNAVAYSSGNNTSAEVKLNGSALTEEDWAVYEALQSKGYPGLATDLHFSIEEATKAYKAAGNDKGKKNVARLKAVKSRQEAYRKVGKPYVDTYDYTYGQGVAVYVGVHEVTAGQYHTSIIIMVSPKSELYNHSVFNTSNNTIEGSGIKYATIGAGPVENNLTAIFGGYLASDQNRDKDKILTIKEDMIDLNITNPETILNLFKSEEHFRANQESYNLDYEFMPLATTNGYNSNSFTRGVLAANNISIPRAPSYSVPGWNKPVPSSYFGK